MTTISNLTALVNQMNWSYSHNGMADISKLSDGADYLNSCIFTEQEVKDAINNSCEDFTSLSDEDAAKIIASDLGVNKLEADGLRFDMFDENGSFILE